MRRTFLRAAAAAALGALAGAGLLALAHQRSPRVDIRFTGPSPGILRGFYGAERSGDRSFAWTSAEASIALQGLDRRVPWRCAARLRGARGAGVQQPTIAIAADGTRVVTATGVNDIATLEFTVAPAPESGLVLAITADPTFVPGPGDNRALGVQAYGVSCEPEETALPSRQALLGSAATTAIFGAAFTLLGASLVSAVAGATAVAVAQAVALTTGLALFTGYAGRLPGLAGAAAAAAVAIAAATAAARKRPADAAIRAALAIAAAGFFVILLALVHPSKAVVDAQFHAHRLAWVQAGRYYFTQPMPDGVSFPYAIALYVVSMPWMSLTRDHIALLRVVVTATFVISGVLVAVAARRRWQDGPAGVIAMLLLLLVPHWYVVVGNANLTSAFGQGAATIALMLAAMASPRNVWQWAGVGLAISVAFLSHVSTFPTLALTLVILAAFSWVVGPADDRAAARWIAGVTIAAALLSVVVYYGQFGEVYRSLDRVLGRAPSAVSAAATADAAPAVAPMAGRFPRGGPTPSTLQRAGTAADVGLEAVGWPIAVLAMAGAVHLARSRARDRLSLAVAAALASGIAVVAFGVLTPVEDRFYRYNVEFIGRVHFATWPAVVALAGLGAARTCAAGVAGRTAAGLLIAWAFWVGASSWWSWIR